MGWSAEGTLQPLPAVESSIGLGKVHPGYQHARATSGHGLLIFLKRHPLP